MDDSRGDLDEAAVINSLTWYETRRAYDAGQLIFNVDQGLALQAAAQGLNAGPLGSIYATTSPLIFLAGILLAIFIAWWWVLVGILLAILLFQRSRQVAVKAVRSAALEDERLFHLFRDKKVIWFERRAE